MAVEIPARKMSKEEKKWRAESDARTLAEAEVILSDPKRLILASQVAKRMASEKMKEAKAMTQIARKKP